MELELQQVKNTMWALFNQGSDLLSEPSIVYQLLFILGCYLVAIVLSRKLGGSFEAYARQIQGKPGLLRLIITLLRRLQWVVYSLLMATVLAVQDNLAWPSTSNFLMLITLQLSLAWLCITLLSQTIRNRSLRKLLAFLGWLYVAMLVLGITHNIADLLDAAGFAVGNTRISLLLLIKIFLVLSFTVWMAIWIGNLIEKKVDQNEEMTPGLKVLVAKILRISLLVLALMIAISGIGIDLTVFSVLSGAIGVGIGFGLQKVVSNFISGLIILADQSIKPGDTITLGDTFGWIRELRARFVSVVTRDGREYLIPNEDFITREVINWSFSDDLVRLDVTFGVSYDASPHDVITLSVAAVETVDRVVKHKKPVCWMTGFGDSSLDFVVRFWIQDPQNGLTNIRGQVLLALWDSFKLNHIGIPYPHREVIFKHPPNAMAIESIGKSSE